MGAKKLAEKIAYKELSMIKWEDFHKQFKASLETLENLSDGGEFKEEIDSLQGQYDELIRIVDRNGVLKRVNIAELRISEKILNHLKNLDVEEKYRKVAPKFDVQDLNISVLSSDDNWHYLAEVGSASNWVSFHLALFCALQEYFIEQNTSSVPSFVILINLVKFIFQELSVQVKNKNLILNMKMRKILSQ